MHWETDLSTIQTTPKARPMHWETDMSTTQTLHQKQDPRTERLTCLPLRLWIKPGLETDLSTFQTIHQTHGHNWHVYHSDYTKSKAHALRDWPVYHSDSLNKTRSRDWPVYLSDYPPNTWSIAETAQLTCLPFRLQQKQGPEMTCLPLRLIETIQWARSPKTRSIAEVAHLLTCLPLRTPYQQQGPMQTLDICWPVYH